MREGLPFGAGKAPQGKKTLPYLYVTRQMELEPSSVT
jgi:hypothetical protein